MKMKTSIKFLAKIQFLALLLLMSFPGVLCAHGTGEMHYPEFENNISSSKDDILGRWLYTVESVAHEYGRGALYITQKDGAYRVEIHVSSGSLHGQDVEVVNDKITFTLLVEGQEVTVALTASGDSLAGESTSSEGTYKIEGKRKPTPQ